jgi:hypothetical protein
MWQRKGKWERARNIADAPIKCEFTDRADCRVLQVQLAAGSKNAERDGEIKGSAALTQICRCEVHGDAPRRPGEAGRPNRSTDPFTRLPYRRVRKPHDSYRGYSRSNVHLNVNRNALDASKCARENLYCHAISMAI